MLTNKKAVIFDLDGTVIDSMWMWKAIDIEYLGRFGIPLPPDLQKRISGMSFSETAVFFKEEFSIPDSLEKIKADWNDMAMDKYRYEVTTKPGVVEFLKELNHQGITVLMITTFNIFSNIMYNIYLALFFGGMWVVLFLEMSVYII